MNSCHINTVIFFSFLVEQHKLKNLQRTTRKCEHTQIRFSFNCWLLRKNLFLSGLSLHFCFLVPLTQGGPLQTFWSANLALRSKRNGKNLLTKRTPSNLKSHAQESDYININIFYYINMIYFTGRRQPAMFWKNLHPGHGLMCFLLLWNLSTYVTLLMLIWTLFLKFISHTINELHILKNLLYIVKLCFSLTWL